MAPTIGAIVKKKEDGESGNVDLSNNLRDGRNSVAAPKMNRSSSNTSMLGQSKIINNQRPVKNWNPTSIRDKSLDASFMQGAAFASKGPED